MERLVFGLQEPTAANTCRISDQYDADDAARPLSLSSTLDEFAAYRESGGMPTTRELLIRLLLGTARSPPSLKRNSAALPSSNNKSVRKPRSRRAPSESP